MSSIFFGKKKGYNKYGILLHQKKEIEDHFSFLRCEIKNNVLVCTGVIQPDGCAKYKLKIEYVAGNEPRSTILSPKVEPGRKIHMYSNHSLCLSYSEDMAWNERTPLYKFTVPWISEWIVFYELYLVNGNIWEGPESPIHIMDNDQNINKDFD